MHLVCLLLLTGLAFTLAHSAGIASRDQAAQTAVPNPLVFQCELGRGNNAAVHLATLFGNNVAVKVIAKAGEHLENLSFGPWQVAREITAMERTIDSPHTVNLHDVYDDMCNVYLVMDYEPLGSVQSALARIVDALHPQLVRRFMVDILQAVGFVHAKGMLHMDVRLANLLLSTDGHLKLCDFGSAEVVSGEVCFMEWPKNYPPECLFLGADFTAAGEVWMIGMAVRRLINGEATFIWENPHYLDTLHPTYSDIVDVLRLVLVFEAPGHSGQPPTSSFMVANLRDGAVRVSRDTFVYGIRPTISDLLHHHPLVRQWKEADQALQTDAAVQLSQLLTPPPVEVTHPDVTFDQYHSVAGFDAAVRAALRDYGSERRIKSTTM